MTALPLLDRLDGPPSCAADAACGSHARRPAPLPPEIAALVRDHPCYSEEAHAFARLHLPVAPACNIQCHYCNRKYDCANESRPGVTSERLTPEAAVERVRAVAARLPELSVVGLAGPGDPLANPAATFATLEGVRRAMPELRLCVSTNGLALPDHAARLGALGVRHVTVTVNAIDPEIGARIYAWVLWRGRKQRGPDAARLLSERQLEGIAAAKAAGALVKVNAVVIPGVNDGHLPEVIAATRAAGAFLVNVVPLLSAPEYGTHYGLTGQRGATPAEVERVQGACAAQGVRLMRHCRQCRADAVGRLGEDRGVELRAAAPRPAANQASGAPTPDARAAMRAAAAQEVAETAEARDAALARLAAAPPRRAARVAVATRAGGRVDAHFGHAREFLVYDVSQEGVFLVGRRTCAPYCAGGDGQDEVLDEIVRALPDCEAVFAARVGRCPAEALARAGLTPVTEHAYEPIEPALLTWFERQVRPAASAGAQRPRASEGAGGCAPSRTG